MTLPHAKSESYQIFDAIAGRYDIINSILSAGLHRIWRRAMQQSLPTHGPLALLDLATGTADVALEMARSRRVQTIQGIDMSKEMIYRGRLKVAAKGLSHRIVLSEGDAQDLKFPDASFDVVTMSFGIRNVPNPGLCMDEIFRVLKPGGRCLILEFGLPEQKILRAGHLFYLRHVLPSLGRLLSGHATAYSYLNKTIEAFPYGEAFTKFMQASGFIAAKHRSLTGGIAQLYQGEKP